MTRTLITAATRPNTTLGLLFVVGVLNIFDRQIVNILGQDIKVELHLSDTQLGLLTGTAFGLCYALLGIPLARVADRVDRIRLIALSLMMWSALTSLCGLAGGFVQLFFARMGVGIGEAGSQPASTALIPDLFSEGRRNSAMSLLLLAVPAGSFLGFLLGGYAAAIWGWRGAFWLAGAPGVVVAAMLLVMVKDPSNPRRGQDPTGVNFARALRALLARSRFRWLGFAMACSTFLVYASGAWLPPMLIRAHHMSVAAAGSYCALAVGLGGGIGALASGFVCDWLYARVRQIESKMTIAIMLVSIPAVIFAILARRQEVVLASMFVYNACAYAWLGPTVTLIQRAATAETRALSIGVSATVASILSLGLGLPLVGALSDALHDRYKEYAVGYALAAAVTLAALAGVLGHWRASCGSQSQPSHKRVAGEP